MNKNNKQVFVRAFLVWMLIFMGAVSLSGCGETISYNSGDSSETTGTEAVSGSDGSKDDSGEEDISGDSSKDVQDEAAAVDGGSEGRSGNGSTDGHGDDVTSDGTLCVFVCGAVKTEGLYYIPAGSRYNDALIAAGGFAEDADTSGINLAAFVTDGENINTASEEELTAISGIGQKKARAIVEYRSQNGAFSSIDEIKNVNGIGDALYEKIKDSICI